MEQGIFGFLLKRFADDRGQLRADGLSQKAGSETSGLIIHRRERSGIIESLLGFFLLLCVKV